MKNKILYLLGPTINTGATISFKVILDGMLNYGHNIVVLISNRNKNNEFIDYMINKGCVVEFIDDEFSIWPSYSLKGWSNSFIKFPWRFVRKYFNLLRSYHQILHYIKKHRPDIVHTNVGVYPQAQKACKKLNIPHIWHLREYQTKDFKWQIFPSKNKFKKLLQMSNVITITQDILNYFELQNIKKAKVMWDGILPVNVTTFIPNKKPYFLCATRISPEKNIETAIEAFAKVANEIPNYRLIIVGLRSNLDYYNKLLKLTTELNCTDKIEFHNHSENIKDQMKDATALIVASHFEGLGRMTLEATFMGCLVLGKNTGGTKEILDNTKGGYLFNTTEELSNLIVETTFLAGSEKYKQIVLAAQQKVVEKCSNENYCNQLNKIYQTTISVYNKNEKNS